MKTPTEEPRGGAGSAAEALPVSPGHCGGDDAPWWCSAPPSPPATPVLQSRKQEPGLEPAAGQGPSQGRELQPGTRGEGRQTELDSGLIIPQGKNGSEEPPPRGQGAATQPPAQPRDPPSPTVPGELEPQSALRGQEQQQQGQEGEGQPGTAATAPRARHGGGTAAAECRGSSHGSWWQRGDRRPRPQRAELRVAPTVPFLVPGFLQTAAGPPLAR